jgi:HD-like signal output (HDOD) protein
MSADPATAARLDRADVALEPPSNPKAFEFVGAIAEELTGGRIDLPSFPDVALRVRRLLAKEDANIADLVRIVGSEPALAVRLLKMANSSALNRSGKPITELPSAIARMGFNMVRSASISFAMAQLQRNNEFKQIEVPMRALWRRSASVAAFAFVLARLKTRVNPDESFLAGLLHGIGRLYILTRLPKFPALLADAAAVDVVMRDWHADVAKAVLENWEMEPTLIDAVGRQDDPAYAHDGPADLSDVLVVAMLLADAAAAPETLALALEGVDSAGRLALDADSCTALLVESGAEIEALRQAIGA